MIKTLCILFAGVCAAIAQTTNYPGALDSASTLFALGDNVQTTLNAAMLPGDTSMTVTSSSGFTANMIVTVCDVITSTGKCTTFEHMLVTAVPNGTTLTVTRAFALTTAIAHAKNLLVSVLWDAAHHTALKNAVIALETALGPNPTVLVGAAAYNWSQTLTQTVNASSSNTITITCPAGITAAVAGNGFYFHLSGGTGSPPAEDDLITATSCSTAGSSGTITFNATSARSGSWTAASSYAGGIEAAYVLGSRSGAVFYQPGTVTPTAAGKVPYSNVRFTCLGAPTSCTIAMPASGTFTELFQVNGVNRVAFDGLAFDGNFINTGAAAERAIYATTVTGLTVSNCDFKNWGYSGAPSFDGTKYGNSAAVKCSACTNARIYSNRFRSNWVQDIVGTGDGAEVRDNQHGTPNLSDVGTNVNYWDTQAGGLAAVDWSASDGVKISGNQVWGTNRFFSPSFAEGNPILASKLTHSVIAGNTISGMTPVPGTCTISGTAVTCTQAIFDSALDVGASFECEGSVGTISRISIVGSATTATLGSGPGNQSNSRCRMQIAGDGIQTNGLTDFRITDNAVSRTGDMGIDVNMFYDGNLSHNVPALRGVISGNITTDNMTCGINLALGQVQQVSFTGNLTMNNHRGTNNNPGARGGFCLSPTPDNVNYYVQSNNSFTGNACMDSASTQTYCFDAETTSFGGGFIGLNQFGPNLWTGGTAYSNVPIAQSQPQTTGLAGGVAAGTLTGSVPVNSDSTAGLITYSAARMVNAVLQRAPSGAVSDVTATAAQLVAQLGSGQAILGTAFYFYLRNTANASNTITITAGAGVTLSGAMTVDQHFQRTLLCQVTNAAASSEAVTCYDMGVVPFVAGADYGIDVASAATTTLGAGSVFTITGTTNITTLNTCDATNPGRKVTLIFAGALTFTDGNNLKLAGNFVTTADDTITLVCNGTNWYEVARSVN